MKLNVTNKAIPDMWSILGYALKKAEGALEEYREGKKGYAEKKSYCNDCNRIRWKPTPKKWKKFKKNQVEYILIIKKVESQLSKEYHRLRKLNKCK